MNVRCILFSFTLLLVASQSAQSAPITLQYAQTSEVGAPGDVVVTYTFDSDETDTFSNPDIGVYLNVEGAVQFGSETISFTNGRIQVVSDTAINRATYAVDSQNVTGTILGQNLFGFQFSIDFLGQIFPSDSLITSAAFLSGGDFGNFSIIGTSFQAVAAASQDPYDIALVAPVPLPTALPLFACGLGLLGFLDWRRKRVAA